MTLKELLDRDKEILVYVYLGKFRLGVIGTSMEVASREMFLFSQTNVPVTLRNIPDQDSEHLGHYRKHAYTNVNEAKQVFFDSAPDVNPSLFIFVNAISKEILE